MKYTKLQMALLAGAYAIKNKGKHIGATFVVFNEDRTEMQEISFFEAAEILEEKFLAGGRRLK